MTEQDYQAKNLPTVRKAEHILGENNMMKRVLALVVMAMLFSFNCDKGCGMAKKEEAKEATTETPADAGAAETAAPAAEEKH